MILQPQNSTFFPSVTPSLSVGAERCRWWGLLPVRMPLVCFSRKAQNADGSGPAESHEMHSQVIWLLEPLSPAQITESQMTGLILYQTHFKSDTLPCTGSLCFDPRADFIKQRIKYPAKCILLRPKDEGCNVWISGLMVSHCQERESMGKETTGFPWRKWRSVGNGILKQKVKTALTKTRWSWCKTPAAGNWVRKPSSQESEAMKCLGYIRHIAVFWNEILLHLT